LSRIERPASRGDKTVRAGPDFDQEEDLGEHDDENDPVPWMQQLMDNPFLLLLLGVFVPMIVYVGWGVWDILTIPMAR